MRQKLNGKSLIAGLLSITLFFSLQGMVSAEVNLESEGNLDWKIQRIINQDKTNNHYQGITEMESRFPTLFQTETLEMINKVNQDNTEDLSELKSSLFDKQLQTNNVLNETRNALFTSDYEAPNLNRQNNEEPLTEDSSMKKIMVGGIIGLIMLAFSTLYMLIRNFF